MNDLSKQMAALMQGIASSASERGRAVADIRRDTAEMLQTFARDRRVSAEACRADLANDRMGRSVEVSEIRDKARGMCEEFGAAHRDMQQNLQDRLAQSRGATMGFWSSLSRDLCQQRSELRKTHRRMVLSERVARGACRMDRSRAVDELMKQLQESRRHTAHALAHSLAESTQMIKAHVAGLRWPQAAFLQAGEGR
ncbi:MAG: hypothetical protein ACT4NV_02670 [Rhodoferax sp.]